jgi:hypothetical protein
MSSPDARSESNFNNWLDSINFIDEDGDIVPHELLDDDSPDPEGDRS